MSSRPLVRSLVGTVVTAAVLAAPSLAPVASADATDPPVWGPTRTLAANPRGESVATGPDGAVTVVWATSDSPGRVLALRRPAGADWTRPRLIGRGSDPVVAVDGRGRVTVVWATGSGRDVVAARRSARGVWSAPVRLAAPAYVVADPALAVDDHGDAVVAWSSRDRANERWRVRAAYRPAGGRWGPAAAVSAADGTRQPQVGIAGDGTAVVLVNRQRFGHPQVLRSLEWAPDGTWSEPSLVTREGYQPTLAVDATGNAVVTFSPDFERLVAVERPAGGDWQTPQALSPPGVDLSDHALAMSAAGEVVIALGRVNGRVDVVRRPAGGTWSAPERVVARGTTVYDVVVALDAAGDAFLGWGGYALLGAYRPAGGAWSAPVTLSPDAGVDVLERTHAVLGPGGDVTVLWKQEALPLKVRVGSP